MSVAPILAITGWRYHSLALEDGRLFGRAPGGRGSRRAAPPVARHGSARRRGKGDHVNVKMPNGQIVTFSGTKEPIKIGLLRAMLRKAGLGQEEFPRLLKGED
jgi:predicted RNA binding protein YcfA (HicA-like mRNA interferase family)